jgi:hypothetical protein
MFNVSYQKSNTMWNRNENHQKYSKRPWEFHRSAKGGECECVTISSNDFPSLLMNRILIAMLVFWDRLTFPSWLQSDERLRETWVQKLAVVHPLPFFPMPKTFECLFINYLHLQTLWHEDELKEKEANDNIYASIDWGGLKNFQLDF